MDQMALEMSQMALKKLKQKHQLNNTIYKVF